MTFNSYKPMSKNQLRTKGASMKGTKQASNKASTIDPIERERLKKIMAKPVNPRTTSLYWLSQGRFKVAD